MRVFALAIMLIGLQFAAPLTAHADAKKPWAEGVPEKDQDVALALYKEGNKFFEESQYKDAYARYEKALRSWKHPAIHYNAAVCLMNMDKPIEALENIEASLRYGDAPLGADLGKQARTYQKILLGQLAEIEVHCTQDGTSVTLDGVPLLQCPGTQKRRLRAGEHQVLGEKPRYETLTKSVIVKGGGHEVVEIELKLLPTPRRQVRRWNRFVPWVVAIVGVGVGVTGIALLNSSNAERDKFECDMPPGCDSTKAAAQLPYLDRAEQKHNLAVGAFAVGGALTAVGAIMIVLNTPKLVPLTAAPMVGPEHAGLAIVGTW